ncbi:Chromatin remodeling [Hyphodiscus hymeniophilus]|uniref:Chromatin remodeling n=1 Tax=Hyphodiscus hymeniophilus TaxID=353542 RepID=A0A9P6VF28_9HELO|nr:Chromatin remodeling [Hyphodiscus hymeniophilus]
MAHMAHAETYEDEETSEEDDITARNGVVEFLDESQTDSDVEVTVVKPKRKWETSGKRVTWSSEDDFEEQKKRNVAKRKKITDPKKTVRPRTSRRPNTGNERIGRPPKKERVWGAESDEDPLDEEIPDYIKQRRREFDKDRETLEEAGLRLPPKYDEVEFSDDDRIADLEERPDFTEKAIEPSRPYDDIQLPHSLGVIPASIAQYLRDYQVDGVAFLHECFVYAKGGILGDDMGLGKTVQVAAFLTAAFGKTGDERDAKRMRKMRRTPGKPWYPRVLIICPGSLMENWNNELNRWGWWHTEKYHGHGKDEALQTIKAGRAEILITTYTTYKNCKDDLNSIPWDCIVADECHQIKEQTSLVTKAMNEVNALCRIGLTGTAIQNKYEELWTLLNWTNPGRLGPISTWKSSISNPLRIGQSHDATTYQLKQARTTAKKLVENLLPQFFLRRMKSLIAHQLPKKTDRVVFCQLTDIQKDAYERFLDSDLVELVKKSMDECDCGELTAAKKPKTRGACCFAKIPGSDTPWKALVFPFMTTLQKLSNHLALLIPRMEDLPEKQARDLEFLQIMLPDHWKDLYEARDSPQTLANPEFCGKWQVLKKLLNHWHENGDKVLIFSHSVKLLRMLEVLFKNTSYNVSFLSGSMPNEERQATVDDFNSDPRQFVFLISTKAGGVGLNITSANKVVIFDPNWNPSYDLQAQDRAYRIGQLRDVEVFRLVSAGTIEEIVYARQIYKQQQANIGYTASTERRYFKGVQNKSDQKGEIFGLQNLFTFHADDIVLRDIVNKTNVAEAKRGVDMIEVDMDDFLNDDDNPLRVDDETEDAAMSQLAALLTEGDKAKKKKPKPKSDPIQAILASAGVQYTHENSEVVGSSKIEAQLSRRAEETGQDVEVGEARMFDESQTMITEPGRVRYEFHPPEDVMMRQFCTMAKTFKFDSAADFALVIEGMTQAQRRDCLQKFYIMRGDRLSELEAKKEMEMGNAHGQASADFVETDDEL